MERVTAREAANRYFQAAVEAAGGSVPALLKKLKAELPDLASELQDQEGRRKAINRATRWKRQNPPPAEVLIAICRVLGLSLDEAAGVTERPRTLEHRVAELEELVHETRRLLDELAEGLDEARERVELPALEYPNRDLPLPGQSSH